MKFLYYLSKLYWVGIFGLIASLFSNLALFKILCFFGLFAFLNIALNFSVWKCSFLQIAGMIRIQSDFKDGLPSVANFKSINSYCLPFKGAWVAVNGCVTKDYSHSWDIPTQRYAYDFLILDENNKSYAGDFRNVSNYYCYNREVISPEGGVIVEVKSSSEDSLIIGNGKFIVKSSHIAGNYIVIKHAENEYSTLAHLQKDSIKVSVGDTVSKGQVIALCGNTGNSSEPHLHFQLQTGKSFYNSAGLPIVFNPIIVKEIKGYEKYDPRPHMGFEDIKTGFVSRGFSFENSRVV